MTRVNARRIVAFVQNVDTVRYWPFMHFVRNSVRPFETPRNPNHPIRELSWLAEPKPFPATGRRDDIFGKKPFLYRVLIGLGFVFCQRSSACGAHIMLAAQAAANRIGVTVFALHAEPYMTKGRM